MLGIRCLVMGEGRKFVGRFILQSFEKGQNYDCASDVPMSIARRERSLSFSTNRDLQYSNVRLETIPYGKFEGEAVHCVSAFSKLAALEDVHGRTRPPSASITSPPVPVSPDILTLGLDLPPAAAAVLKRRSVKALAAKVVTCDIGTITEVCSADDLPEVEIISLLEEQIPQYKLRADTLTKFSGYENQDWFIPAPALKVEDADLNLSPELIRETLNYFLLCSNRVSQMSRAYNDIEAVTRLLEEKERDLELTARIGKELLQTNSKLETNVTTLESELKSAQEKITQLSYELLKKTELVQILTNDVDDSSEASTPSGFRSINLDLMQKRISSLEDENKCLRNEYQRIANDTDNIEAQEARLVQDIALQLASANIDVNAMGDELERVKEENRVQQDQITSLTTKLNDAETNLCQLTVENEEIKTLLHYAKETQNSLASELSECKERYAEVLDLLRDTQEQLRRQRKSGMPTARGNSLYPSLCNTAQPDSLQSELQSSLYSELSLDSGISGTERSNCFKKVFETVRCTSQASSLSGSALGGPTGIGGAALCSKGGNTTTSFTSTMSSYQPRMSSFQQGSRFSSMSYGSSLGYVSLDSKGQSDSESTQTDSEESYPGGASTGIPGAPGAADLEAALRRLTPAEVSARRATLSAGSAYGGYDYDNARSSLSFLPYGTRTPDSIMSADSSGIGGHLTNTWKLPEKVQIVKPMEGSQTLHHWSQLAVPTLIGLLSDQSGVKIRGARALKDMGLETYTLSDLEEDDAEFSNPGKRFESSGCIYTYTTSTVLHPDEVASVTESVQGSRVASVCPSEHGSPPATPTMHSRRNSTSTFSTTFGLAKMLNERGIKAVTPSCVNTPSGVNSFTPTATPCNSPDGSPPESRSSSPPPMGLGFLSTGTELLRRTLEVVQPGSSRRAKPSSKLALSRSDKKALSRIRIVEKIERIGLDSIMSSSALPISPLAGPLYAKRSENSPMTQLTSLKSSNFPSSSSSSTTIYESEQEVITKKPPLKASSNNSRLHNKHLSSPLHDQISRERTPDSVLGIPSKPGSGQLNRRLEQLPMRHNRRNLNMGGVTRSDLGTVGPTSSSRSSMSRNSTPERQPTATIGTLSSLLFGRKGGLI